MISIRFKNNPDTVPPQFIEADGLVYLDLPENFEITEFKSITELSPENEFKINYTVSSNLEPTPKNRAALKKYWNPNIQGVTVEPVPVEVFIGGSALSDVELYVDQYDTNTIAITLVFDRNYWINRIKNLYLNKLDLGRILHNYSNIVPLFEKNVYSVGDLGVYTPLVDYGRTKDLLVYEHNIPVEFFRYWFHTYHLLRTIFCYAGLEFISPFFESYAGRQLIDYLYDPAYGTYIIDGIGSLDSERSINAKTQVTDSALLPLFFNKRSRAIPMPLEISDNGTHHNGTNWFYEFGSGEIDLTATIFLTFSKLVVLVVANNPASTQMPKLKLFRFDKTTKIETVLWESEEIIVEDQQYEFNIELKNISLTFNEALAFGINYDNGSIVSIDPYRSTDTEKTTYIKCKGVRKYPTPGTFVNLASTIDPKLTALAYLKEKTRQYNLKWYAELASNKIYAMQPYSVNILQEYIEGFFIEVDIIDIINKIDPDSGSLKNPELSRPRYIEVGYAKSNDPGVREGLFDKKVDLGPKFTVDESLELRLKDTSATAVADYGGIFTARTNAGKRYPFTIPVIRSTEEVEHHWKIQYRSLIAFGNRVHGDGTIPRAKVRINNTLTEWIPTAAMLPKMLDLQYYKWSIIYGYDDQVLTDFPGSEVNANIYELLYKRDLLEKYDNQTLSYLVDMSRNWFQSISFRNIYSFMHEGRTIICRMDKISSYLNSIQVPTPVDFIPFKRALNICEDDGGLFTPPPPDLYPCNNNVWLNHIDLGNGCHSFTIDGEVGSIIEGAVFQYRDEDSEDWVDMEFDTIFSGFICKNNKSFFVRAIVDMGDYFYQACPDITTDPIYIPICPNPNDFILNCNVYTDINNSICAEPVLITPVQAYSVDYLYDIGEGFTEYTGPVCNLTDTITFKAVITVNNCLPVEIENTCLVKIDCDNIQPLVQCSVEAGCFIALRAGTLSVGLSYDDYILYRVNDGEGWSQWVRWDEQTPICSVESVQFKRVVLTCDSLCPVTCSPIVTCELPCSFPGTSKNYYLCNDGSNIL